MSVPGRRSTISAILILPPLPKLLFHFAPPVPVLSASRPHRRSQDPFANPPRHRSAIDAEPTGYLAAGQQLLVGHSIKLRGRCPRCPRSSARCDGWDSYATFTYPRARRESRQQHEGRGSRVQLTTGRMMMDADVTDNCPVGFRCESCGGSNGGLHVKVYDILDARMCLTVCSTCAGSGRAPAILLTTAERFAAQHCQHVAGYTTHPRPRSEKPAPR